MRTKFLPFISLAFLIASFIFVAPEMTFARGFLHQSNIGPGDVQASPTASGGETNNNGAAPSRQGEGQQPSQSGGESAAQSASSEQKSPFGCNGIGCDDQDPGVMGCNKSRMLFAPFQVADAAGDILATGQNVYSVGCNANWTEGTLTALGRNIIVQISTTDSQGRASINCFPHNPGGVPGYNCTLAGYNGETGWPAFSNMVDGTNLTKSVLQVTGPDGRQYLGSVSQ